MNTDCRSHNSVPAGHLGRRCQALHDGIPCGLPAWPGAADWQLLLQIDSDPNTGMMWGDVGKLYFLMNSEDLRNRNFDAAWLILQC